MPTSQLQKPEFRKRVSHNSHDGFETAIKVFQEAAVSVPAYKDFLHKHHIQPADIVDREDFLRVPIMTKENYLRQYPLKDLQIKGDFSGARIVSMSSGSTGLPLFWPRGTTSVEESADILDQLFAQVFDSRNKETLCIIAYAMGTWIAGTYMLSAINRLTDRGHKFSVTTPGINKEEIVQIFDRIGSQFDQVLIMGYPPFVKDAIELAREQGIQLKDYNLKFMFSSEHFSETWRDYVLNEVSPGYSPYNSLSLYGAADTGIIGMESPLLIYCRRIIDKDQRLFKHLFPATSILPTIVNVNPLVRYVEEIQGNLIISLRNSLPLIRYDIRDQGRVLMYDEFLSAIKSTGHPLPEELVSNDPPWPIISLYGRVDVAAMFYGVNIYPENIKSVLEKPALQKYLTGKFFIKTEYDQEQEQSLHLYLETKSTSRGYHTVLPIVQKNIKVQLRKVNSEYNKLCEAIGTKSDPIVTLKDYGSPGFEIGTKHRWVVKS